MITSFTKYLNKQTLLAPLINIEPSENLKHIVVIPAINEPEILNTIESLTACIKPKYSTEIIVVINHTEATEEPIKKQNKETHQTLEHFSSTLKTEHLQLHTILIEDLDTKYAGAGLARKIGMDEAIRRFVLAKQNYGTIISLDADTLVSPNYLMEIENAFSNIKKVNCCIFEFEHRLNENKFGDKATNAMIKYELYLRYYKEALKYTGFPYSFYTIGSCFAVSAEAYTKQGGMNRKQAGEDFYFLQKIFPLEKTIFLNQVTVYPSARLSDRVPFGTGPAIIKIIEEGELLSYQFEAFNILKTFFDNIKFLYHCDENELLNHYKKIDYTIQNFVSIDEYEKHIKEIKKNSASEQAFTKRFFQWFNALKIIRYLNYSHENNWDKKPIEELTEDLLKSNSIEFKNTSTIELLNNLKQFNKNA